MEMGGVHESDRNGNVPLLQTCYQATWICPMHQVWATTANAMTSLAAALCDAHCTWRIFRAGDSSRRSTLHLASHQQLPYQRQIIMNSFFWRQAWRLLVSRGAVVHDATAKSHLDICELPQFPAPSEPGDVSAIPEGSSSAATSNPSCCFLDSCTWRARRCAGESGGVVVSGATGSDSRECASKQIYLITPRRAQQCVGRSGRVIVRG